MSNAGLEQISQFAGNTRSCTQCRPPGGKPSPVCGKGQERILPRVLPHRMDDRASMTSHGRSHSFDPTVAIVVGTRRTLAIARTKENSFDVRCFNALLQRAPPSIAMRSTLGNSARRLIPCAWKPINDAHDRSPFASPIALQSRATQHQKYCSAWFPQAAARAILRRCRWLVVCARCFAR